MENNIKQYDNKNKVAAWTNEDGSIFLKGNLNGQDFKIKLFKNTFKKAGSKEPDLRGQFKIENDEY